MKRTQAIILFLIAFAWQITAQVQITVNPSTEIRKIPPAIYGRNNNLSGKSKEPVNAAQWQLYRDAGLQFFREGGGNNSTKYNWKKKLTSHPDWYNNVYAIDWDYAAQSLSQNMPEAKGMWSFQLIGYAASTNAHNFDDWAYNQSKWTEDCNKNWCANGDISKYLEPWDAEATTGILNHWFDELKLPKEQFRYWSMDNEPDIWDGTHDDVITEKISAEEYLESYIQVAVKARTLFPNIKIVGPVFTNEWQWYNWQTGTIPADGKRYTWLEYFIKRIAEEQARTGLRLVDVLDFHFYPGSNMDVTLQLHRVFYDTSYDYPGANGVKVINGGWDNSQTKEYIFKRATDWLNQYMGVGHGVTMGLSEYGNAYNQDANVTAVHYASLLGTFAQNNVEIFSPWEWNYGYWEVMHLFTRYGGTISLQSTSSNEEKISAYASINEKKDMLSVVLVNRDRTATHSVKASLGEASLASTSAEVYRLSNLPANQETFKSATDNALQTLSALPLVGKGFDISLPPLSITMVRVPVVPPTNLSSVDEADAKVYFDSASGSIRIVAENFTHKGQVTLTDLTGRRLHALSLAAGNDLDISIPVLGLSKGIYLVTLEDGVKRNTWKINN